MDDFVEIGVFAGWERMYLRQHRVHSGKQRIVVTVPRLPTRAGIDPNRTLIERGARRQRR